jgi:hypothetical protein
MTITWNEIPSRATLKSFRGILLSFRPGFAFLPAPALISFHPLCFHSGRPPGKSFTCRAGAAPKNPLAEQAVNN